MPRLNAVLMAALALATIATAGFLALERTADLKPAPVRVEPLLRKLADRDPDLRREGEESLRALGPRAVAHLRDAAKSPDRTLADRASKLLLEMEPAPAGSARAPEPREPEPTPEARESVEFELRAHPTRVKPGDPIEVSVTLTNNGSQPVLVMGSPYMWVYLPMAEFEFRDSAGKVTAIKADVQPGREAGQVHPVHVRPGEHVPLFRPTGYLTLRNGLPAGSYKVRFVYEASEGSPYRLLVPLSSEGVLLPPRRLVSNEVAVEVTE